MLVCSVIARNFVPQLRVLGRSLREHHPGAELRVLIVDAPDGGAAGEPFTRLSPDEAGVPLAELRRRRTMYGPQALVSSLKARLLAAQLASSGEPVLLLDADTLVLGPLDDVLELAGRHGLVLSPHSAVPLPFRPGGLGPEQEILRAGVVNGGFVAVAPGAEPFLHWWDERCARDCVWDADRALALSQTWLTLAPALFDHHLLRDRGVNLMGHGLAGDDVRWEGDRPFIGAAPLRLFHFAGGFDPRHPELGGPRAPDWWPRAADRPGLARLCAAYAERLLAAGHGTGAAPDDGGLDWAMRAAYREALIAAEAAGDGEPPNPFADGGAEFAAWLGGPRWEGSDVSRYVAALWAGRTDLRSVFPAVPGADAPALIAWADGERPTER